MFSRLLAFAALLSCGAAAQTAVAQTCGAIDTISNVGAFFGNSCGKNPALAIFCAAGNVSNGFGISLFQFATGAGASTLALTPTSLTSGFNPELALIGAACSSFTDFLIDANNNAQTVGPDFSTPMPGDYFVLVADLNTEAPGCGDFSLGVGGLFAVILQEFSVG